MLFSIGVYPKSVQEMLGHASIRTTLDTYSHAMPGLQEAAAQRLEAEFDKEALRLLLDDIVPEEDVRETLDAEGEVETEPRRNRTFNLLIKSQLLCQLS